MTHHAQSDHIEYDDEIASCYSELGDDNGKLLLTELSMFHMLPSVKETAGAINVDGCANILRQMAPDMRAMFTHVERLTCLLLVNPASSAASETRFSSLRRLKTYLRSTLSQQRLNNLATCHAYKDQLDKININHLIAEFVACRDSRASIFGKIDKD